MIAIVSHVSPSLCVDDVLRLSLAVANTILCSEHPHLLHMLFAIKIVPFATIVIC